MERTVDIMHDTIDTFYTDKGEKPGTLQDTPCDRSYRIRLESDTIYSMMSLPVLAEHGLREISNYRHGDPFNEQYGIELFRRATVQGEQEAWYWLQCCFYEILLSWVHCHPSRDIALHLDSEENYVAQAFERFWQATARVKKVEFHTLAAALRYLQVSLNGAIVDTLRAYSRPREIPLPESGSPGEPLAKDGIGSGEVWAIIQKLLSNACEQRVAYLLFHCGLKPREIVRCCPQEFKDVQEIYRIRRNITERLLRNADYLRWQLGVRREESDRSTQAIAASTQGFRIAANLSESGG